MKTLIFEEVATSKETVLGIAILPRALSSVRWFGASVYRDLVDRRTGEPYLPTMEKGMLAEKIEKQVKMINDFQLGCCKVSVI